MAYVMDGKLTQGHSDENIYFATMQDDELLAALDEKIGSYYEYLKVYKVFTVWLKSYNTYYGRDRDGFNTYEVGRSGTQGELSILKVNHYRNLIQHLFVMTTGTRPFVDCRSINTDYKSQVQTILAKGIVDYYMNEKKVERFINTATEYALLFGEGYTVPNWDPSLGETYGTTPEGMPLYEGDCEFRNYAPMDVIRDVNLKNIMDSNWFILRDYLCKFDLSTKFPAQAEKILSSRTNLIEDINLRFHFSKSHYQSHDMVPVYTFIHKKTPALPQGRFVMFIPGTKLIDSAFPYRRINVHRIAPSEWVGSPFGYTPAFDLLALQDVVDALYGTVATNQLTFGVQSITAMEGANVSAKKLATGLNLITFSKLGGKPEPLNLTMTPPEIFKFLQQLEQAQETLIGVNSVNRGNPEASLRSGNALALVASQAIQFNSGLQASYSEHIEDVFTSLITMLQDYAVTPRIATIAGSHNRSYMQEFKGTDIDKVSRVVVDLGNSVMRTNAGRLEVANNLLQMQQATPEQYITVINTGRLEPMYESQQKQLLLIRAENENMSNGQPVIAIVTDMHDIHIREHQCVLADPEVRKNLQVVQAALAHINEHIDMKETVRPALLMALGMQPLPPDPQLIQNMKMKQAQAQGQVQQPVPNMPNNLGMTEPQPGVDITTLSQGQPQNPLAGQRFGYTQEGNIF
jgi:hypothetical protein